MATSIIPKLNRIMAGGRRSNLTEDNLARVAVTLAVLTGLSHVVSPVAASTLGSRHEAQTITLAKVDDGVAASFEAAIGKGAPDAAFLRAMLAERVAEKRVMAEALRAGLSTAAPEPSQPRQAKGAGTALRDVRPYEDAVDASYEGALRDDPGHADLITAVKAQRDAEAEVTHQADLIAGVEEADAPSPP